MEGLGRAQAVREADPASPRGHAVITGGSSGIGLALARRLVARGWNVTIIARDAARLARARATLAEQRIDPQQQVIALAADVADRPAIEAAIEQSLTRLGGPDLLITSAGICEPGRVERLPVEVFERTMQVNYLGSLYAALACLPAMRSRGRGRIVLIASGAGLLGVAGYAAYGPPKFALRGLAEILRAELKPRGIGVTVVYPGDTETPQLAHERTQRPPETARIAGLAPAWPVDRMAEIIMRGIDKNRAQIAPGFQMTMLLRFGDLLKPLLFWHFDRMIRKIVAADPPA